MRILCLFFPRLSLQLALQQRPELAGRAVATVDTRAELSLISAASPEATARGVVTGMTTHQARLRCPGLAFLPDNAGTSLDELERISSIIRRRATTIVAIASREELLVDLSALPSHLGADEAEQAERILALARMWSGLTVRAGVASSRAEAREAARAARLAPAIRRPVLAWGEPPLQPASTGPLAVEVLIPLGTSPLAARAKLLKAARQVQVLLDGTEASFREVRATVRDADGSERHLRKLIEPATDVEKALAAGAPILGDEALATATSIRIELGRLGPDVRIAPAAREVMLRAG